MKNHDSVGQKQMDQTNSHEQSEGYGVQLNFEVQAYLFHDLDLAMAVEQLSQRDKAIVILHLMGHTQNAIAEVFSLSRSMISKRLTAITGILKGQLSPN